MLKENGGDDAGSFYAYIQQKENRENGGEIDHNDINFNLNNINFHAAARAGAARACAVLIAVSGHVPPC